jgi:hypothetical protein
VSKGKASDFAKPYSHIDNFRSLIRILIANVGEMAKVESSGSVTCPCIALNELLNFFEPSSQQDVA